MRVRLEELGVLQHVLVPGLLAGLAVALVLGVLFQASSMEFWLDPGSISSSGTGSMVQQACHLVVWPVRACAW